MMKQTLLQGLNAQQQAVVTDVTHHILLNAPAGTGKTSVLARRIAAILDTQKAEASQLLCLTFTNRACKELKHKIVATVHEKGLDVVVKTIHSFCYSLIKEEGKASSSLYNDAIVYDDEDCKQLISDILVRHAMPLSGSNRLQKLQNFIEIIKKYPFLHPMDASAMTCENAVSAFLQDDAAVRSLCAAYDHSFDKDLEQWLATNGLRLFQYYEQTLADNHALDFADLITSAYRLLCQDAVCRRWQDRFRYIAIDEMQDTSEIEYYVLSKLFPGRIILLCGDYFQTIYEWRGSYPDLILRQFTAEFSPRRITFTINYRATQLLLEASSACVSHLFGPAVRQLYPVPSTAASSAYGEPIVVKEAAHFMEEARWIFHEIAKLPQDAQTKTCIMTRTNRYNKEIWNGVRSHNERLPAETQLPFTMIDQFQLFKRQECKDVIAFLRLFLNKHDALSLKRIVKRFAKRIGPRTLAAIESDSYRRLGISLCDFIDPETAAYGDPFGHLITALSQEDVIVFDVESTGTDTTQDEIIQIAAIRLDCRGYVKDRFMTYVRATRSVGDSYYVHHISDELLQQKGRPPQDALTAFLQFAGSAVIVGHNVTYDLQILRSELSRLHLTPLGDVSYYDTLDIFRRFYPNVRNHKLGFLSDYFSLEDKPSHDAFDDIMATAALLRYALQQHIVPEEPQRRACIAMYAPLFAPIGSTLQKLRALTYTQRPCGMIAQVMLQGGVKAYYTSQQEKQLAAGRHIDRIENIRKLYRLAQELDTHPHQDARDALTEFLQLTSLSNSELDTLLAKKPRIPIITVHQAKGLEFDYVFLACLQEGTFPLSRAVSQQELDEEKRLFYVAMTRAKKRLYLSWHRQEGRHLCQPSPLIDAIPAQYKTESSDT